jgi:hypothetical protein
VNEKLTATLPDLHELGGAEGFDPLDANEVVLGLDALGSSVWRSGRPADVAPGPRCCSLGPEACGDVPAMAAAITMAATKRHRRLEQDDARQDAHRGAAYPRQGERRLPVDEADERRQLTEPLRRGNASDPIALARHLDALRHQRDDMVATAWPTCEACWPMWLADVQTRRSARLIGIG